MKPRKIDYALVALGAALLVGGYLRFYELTNRSLFLDEAFTIWVASKPWPAMMDQIVYHDFHPPVFYAVTHWLIGALHWQPWDYRYLTAPFGLLTIVASWAIARRLFGDVAAGVTAFVVAVEPSLVDWDRVFRMYSVLTALCATSWWLILIAQEKTGRKRIIAWLGYSAVAILVPYIQYLGAVTLVCQGAYALLDLRKRWPVIASGVAAIIALAPWMWAIRIQAPHGGLVAGTNVVPIGWVLLPRDVVLAGVPLDWSGSIVFAWSVTAFVAIVATVAVVRWPKTIVPFWLGVAAVQVLATLATGKGLVIPRYLLPALPGFAVAIGGLAAWLIAGRLRVLGAALAVAVPAVAAVCSADIVWDPFYQFTDWYLVNLIVLQNEKPSDAMLFVQGFPYLVVGDFTAFRGHPAEGPAMPADLPFTLDWIRKHASQRIWYIENQPYYADPKHQVKRYLDSTRSQLHVWSEARAGLSDIVNIVLYDKQTKRPSTPMHHVRAVTKPQV